jgi:hypothetical protein
MNTSINDEDARIFSAQFYNAIGFGKSIEDAYDQARLQVRLELGTTSGDPRLTRVGLTPSDVYLVRPPI